MSADREFLEDDVLALREAWKDWDRHSGDRERVVALQTALRVVADRLGVTAQDLQIETTTARRVKVVSGMHPNQALSSALYETTNPRSADART